MSFLLGGVKAPKKELPKREEPKQIAQKAESLVQKTGQPVAQKPTVKEQPPKETKTPVKTVKPVRTTERMTVKKPTRALTADEKLQESFLKRLRKLGGDYFEYYSVYLLERYSRMNGRRLESLKITGGDHDGGIDGEIELTDRLGFRETIYIQAKNWDPDKGEERLWVVGETLLQQFIGACVCRQAKDGKQHCRGIFITTSRFTAEAKKILDDTSDKFVGYDGADLYEAAKECSFGLVKKNGEWTLDEELLSGEKAFFKMY
ncbi:MAG: restriction endonuclease [Clostridia bacterium]|nr:restriction endonuclease [Clostridia bacterium]